MSGIRVIQGVTGPYESELERLSNALEEADAVIIGAGAGMSTSAGLSFGGKRYTENFGDFIEKYGITDMYSGCFHEFESREERWAFRSRIAWLNRFSEIPKDTLQKLLHLVEDKDYFVLTTNVDHSFIKAGFPKEKQCYTQGDFGLFRCSVPCHAETYDNEEIIRAMHEQERDMKVPTELIPHCPKCGAEMDFNLFWDETFVRDRGWHIAHDRYERYVRLHEAGRVICFELGVGYNSPGVIKFPFRQMTARNPRATYVSVNLDTPSFPESLESRSIIISEDIDRVLTDLTERKCARKKAAEQEEGR